MKVFIGSERKLFMTSFGVQIDIHGRYIVNYLIRVKLFGILIFDNFFGVITNAEEDSERTDGSTKNIA